MTTTRRAIGAVAVLAAVTGLLAGQGVAAASAAPHNQDIWVSPDGSDSAPGTAARPVRTLAKAQRLVRARDNDMTSDLTVHLAPGVFRLDQPLTLTAADSGTNGHQVVWQGSGGTVLSGGKQVRGWRPVPGRPGLYAAHAPAGLDNTRQLYVDGVREQRAAGRLPVTLTSTATGYTASSDTMAHWHDPGDMEFVYTAGEALWNLQRDGLGQWTEPRCPVGSISGTTITMAQPCWDNSTKRAVFPDIPGRSINMVGPYDLTNGRQPTYVENAFELLDTPGEWYLDRSSHTVYYMPKPGQDLRHADVEMPVLQQLVAGQDVHDIAFRNIQFSYATWLTPSSPEGFSEIQAGYTTTGPNGYAVEGLCQFTPGGTCPYASWTPEPGNVSLSHARDIEFSDSVFTHLGAAGLRLGDGTQDSVVRGDVFTDISGNGIEIGGVDQPEATDSADITSGDQVLDNHIYDLPVEFHGGVGILNGYTQHNTIAHNQLDHLSYAAISMGWGGWPDKIKVQATPNISHDNAVSDNLIYDYMLMLDDGGGIYTQGITGTSLADGEKVTGNVIHDQWGIGKAVYTDNGNTYETVQGNVLYGVAYYDVGTAHVDYRDNLGNNDPTLIEGNYWEQGDKDGNNKGVITQGNHILANPASAPSDIVANAGIEPAYRWVLSRQATGDGAPFGPERISTFAGDGSVYATWSPTDVSNGAPVTAYVVTASDGTHRFSTIIDADTFWRTGYAEVTGLTNGTAYTVAVTARNRFGTSEPFLPAAPVTPGPLAGNLAPAPTGAKAIPTTNAATLKWTPPTTTGDTPVIGYRVTVSDGRTITVTGRDAILTQPTAKSMMRVIDGLTPGTAYTFTVATITADGAGPAATVHTTTTTS
jgi:hypothetical protein